MVIDLDAVDADSVSPVKFAELCLYSQAIVNNLLCLFLQYFVTFCKCYISFDWLNHMEVVYFQMYLY